MSVQSNQDNIRFKSKVYKFSMQFSQNVILATCIDSEKNSLQSRASTLNRANQGQLIHHLFLRTSCWKYSHKTVFDWKTQKYSVNKIIYAMVCWVYPAIVKLCIMGYHVPYPIVVLEGYRKAWPHMQMNIPSQVAVQIGSQPLLENTVVEGFELKQNPAIRKWDRNTLMIEKKANSFKVPGQHLNSGKFCSKLLLIDLKS